MLVLRNKSWVPSTFYDGETELVWVFDFKLYKKIVENKVKDIDGKRYAIRKDVKQSYDELYRLKYRRVNAKKTRKNISK